MSPGAVDIGSPLAIAPPAAASFCRSLFQSSLPPWSAASRGTHLNIGHQLW